MFISCIPDLEYIAGCHIVGCLLWMSLIAGCLSWMGFRHFCWHRSFSHSLSAQTGILYQSQRPEWFVVGEVYLGILHFWFWIYLCIAMLPSCFLDAICVLASLLHGMLSFLLVDFLPQMLLYIYRERESPFTIILRVYIIHWKAFTWTI